MEEQKRPAKRLSKQQARPKIESYCAYQERSQKEVRNRLYDLGLPPPDVEELIADLIQGNFLNEERFAMAYAGGKFRMKGWGRKKIKAGLKLKGVPDRLLNKALYSIDDDDYFSALTDLLERKSALMSEKDEDKRRNKLIRHALARGFEMDLIFEALKGSEL